MEVLKIVKIGGAIIDDDMVLNEFLIEFSKLSSPKILIHGGGNEATRLANRLNIPIHIVDGRRLTDSETLDIILMVYAGKLNKSIVAKLQGQHCNVIGFTGADGNTIVSEKRKVASIDYGLVGDISAVNTEMLQLMLSNNITPVFCAITHDGCGQLLNTNADTIASELAIGLADHFETELYYCFEKNGVLKDVNNDASVIEEIDTKSYKSLVAEGVISDGMLPKLNNCFHAIDQNVKKVCIGKPDMLFNSKAIFTTIQE